MAELSVLGTSATTAVFERLRVAEFSTAIALHYYRSLNAVSGLQSWKMS